MSASYLSIQGLIKTYPPATGKGKPVVVVDGFDLEVEEGEFVTLIGHSGCGKSTVLMILAGLSDATEGQIALAGNELRGPGLERGIVFQGPPELAPRADSHTCRALSAFLAERTA